MSTLSIYDLARELVQSKTQWYAGELVELWTSKSQGGPRIIVQEGGRDGGGWLHMTILAGPKSATVPCGYYSWSKGAWVFDLPQHKYQDWKTKAQRLAELHAKKSRKEILQ